MKRSTEWRELGFQRLQVQGRRARSPSEDAERFEAARDAAGDDFVLTIDANQGYTRSQALELCQRVADLNIRWFEEPCIWSNDRATCATYARSAASRLRRAERVLARRPAAT